MNEIINIGNGAFVKITMLKGERGSNIASIEKTSTSPDGLIDTYTITLTDGHTTSFQVTNGANIGVENLAYVQTTNVANKPFKIGDHIVLQDKYCVVTQAIAQGDTIVINTNVKVDTVGDEIQLLSVFVTPQMFGAKGDGITDDREALQNAIDYAIDNHIQLYIPAAEDFYAIKSYQNIDGAKVGLIISDCINIIGDVVLNKHNSYTKWDINYLGDDTLDVLLLIDGTNNSNISTKIENLVIGCRNNVTKGIATKANVSCTKLHLKNLVVAACEIAYDLVTMVSKIELCEAWFCSDKGFYIHGVAPTSYTSTILDTCYAMNAYHADIDSKGFVLEYMWYSTLLNCACDAYKTAYDIMYSRSISILSCGCERVHRALHCSTWIGGTVDNLLCLPYSSDVSDDLIYLSGGHGITFNNTFVATNKPTHIYFMDIYTNNIYINDPELTAAQINMSGSTKRVALPFTLNGVTFDDWNVMDDTMIGDGIHKGQMYVGYDKKLRYYNGDDWVNVQKEIGEIKVIELTITSSTTTINANTSNNYAIGFNLPNKPKLIICGFDSMYLSVDAIGADNANSGYARITNYSNNAIDLSTKTFKGIAFL